MSNRDESRATTRSTRRNFLKTSTAAAGTAALGSLAIGRSAHAQGSDILKVGLVGCGGRGTGAAVNALNADKNAKLTAMADVFEDRLKSSRERIIKSKPDQMAVTDENCFIGFDAYQKLIASGVDVVVLATTPQFRPIQLRACVEAGKHVFCEKPVSVDGPGTRSVLESAELAKKKGLSIVSGLCWRYHPGVKETIGRILDGAIGDIVAIQETYLTGALWKRERQPDQTEMQYQMRNWYNFHWLSGDFNVEQHIHSLDKAGWLMGDEPPVSAWGTGGRQVDAGPKHGDIYDHHAVCYEYANGVRAYSYCRQQAGCWNNVTDVILGTKGRANVLKFQIDGEKEWRYKGKPGNMYDLEHEALFAAIRGGKPINNGVYMARSTMLAVMGRMVDYTGQQLTWDQAINSKEDLSPKSYSFDAEPPVMPGPDGRYPMAIPGVTKFV